jgi:DNA polymerase III delta subunit
MKERKSSRSSGSRSGILDFLAQPPPAPLPNLIVLFGKEHLLADRAIRTIVNAAMPDAASRDLNVDTIEATNIGDAGDVSARLAAIPFLADRRVVVLRGSIDARKDARDLIVQAARDVPLHALLVVDHSGRPARPQGRRPKDEAAQIAAGTAGALVLECNLDAAACVRFVDQGAAERGLTIEAQARAMLAATEDASEIDNALERLALVTKHVRLADVRDYAIPSQDAELWNLADAIANFDSRAALKLAREFDRPIAPLQWLATDAQVIWELSRGTRADDYARASGQNPFRISKLSRAAKQLSPERARRDVDLTMKALELCLTGRRDWDETLDEVIVRLCEKPR